MSAWVFSVIGLAGVALIIWAYFLLEDRKISTRKQPFHLMNLSGSLLILVSLSHDWNLPTFLVECAWVGMSIYGMFKNYARRAKKLYKFPSQEK